MFRIGELAKRYGINADTLRFYEKHGLLAPSSRSDNGYRVYSAADEQKLAFILRAKAVGFSLGEITELLSIEVNKSQRVCSDVKDVVDDKLMQVNEKIAELERFRFSLQLLSDSCCGGSHSAEQCTILQALESCEPADFSQLAERHAPANPS